MVPGELEQSNNVHLLHVNDVKKSVPFYNLDVIISVAAESEYSGLFDVITDFVYILVTLDEYDYQTLFCELITKKAPFRITYENAMLVINTL